LHQIAARAHPLFIQCEYFDYMFKSLKTIACLKAFRGSIASLIGISLLYLNLKPHDEVWADHPLLVKLAANDPFFQIIINFFASLTGDQLISIAFLALILGILRFVEATGIWLNKNWAHWIAVSTGFIYIPFEVYELISRFNWTIAAILVVNTLIVLILLYVLYLNKNSIRKRSISEELGSA